MLFNSELFLFAFLPLTLAGMFALQTWGSDKAVQLWLIVASSVFYGWFNVRYLPLLGVLILFNFFYGAALAKDARSRAERPVKLAIGVGVNLAILAYYKYTNFFISNLNEIVGTNFVLQQIILPLGISFFTFQKIAYLVDAYRGQTRNYTLLEFSLFVMFFPQLIAGPIVHHNELIPQLNGRLRIKAVDLAAGITLFTIGLLKKAVIADPMASQTDPLFALAKAGQAQPFFDSWAAALGFTFQIYFDFSGYTDMALGLALMMGIRLPQNFHSPYKAENIVEFWRRWHMTLSRFLRDYVYIALGGNRRGAGRRYANLMATMVLGGLWHGAAWTFVAWGALHGGYLVINHAWHKLRPYLGLSGQGGWVSRWLARALTFFAVVIAWVFFRAENFQAAWILLKGMGGLYGLAAPSGYVLTSDTINKALTLLNGGPIGPITSPFPLRLGLFALILLAVWLLPNSQQILAHLDPTREPVPHPPKPVQPSFLTRVGVIDVRGGVALTPVTGLLAAAALLGAVLFQAIRSTSLQQFIYFQF